MKRKDITVCIGAFFTAIVLFCICTNVWNMDIRVPFVYGGDVSGTLINVKSVMSNKSLWHYTEAGAPYYTNMFRQLMDGALANGMICLVALITNSIGFGINFYYILTYGLSAICAYYVLRKFEVEMPFAFLGAIVYALIPGHFQRGETHLFIGSCFSIPLIILAGVRIYDGATVKYSVENKKTLTCKELFRCNNKNQYFGLFALLLTNLLSLYHGVFALIYFTFCSFICLVNTKRFRYFFSYIQYAVLQLICIIVIFLPSFLANKYDPVVENVPVITRYLFEVELYAGKLIQLIMPIQGHRVSALSRIREIYDSTFPLINENSTSSLGLLMSIGFLAGLMGCFVLISKQGEKIQKLGKHNLFLFLLGTVGGFGAIIGFVNYDIRCYNRVSFFIGAISIVIIVILIQQIFSRIKLLHREWIKWIVSAFMIMFALFDQTTDGMRISEDYGDWVESLYYNDMRFVNDIETYEGENANILVFPLMNAQEMTLGITREGIWTNYMERLPSIHSKTSNWALNSKAGEMGERWINWLEQFSLEKQITLAAISGYNGISVYHNGFSESSLSALQQLLHEYLGEPVIVHNGGTWSYYTISDKKRKEITGLSDIIINQCQEELYKHFVSYNPDNIDLLLSGNANY